MTDVEKEIAYWRDGAVRDLQFANRLITREEEEILGLKERKNILIGQKS